MKGLSKGRYDETFAGEDAMYADLVQVYQTCLLVGTNLQKDMTAA